MPRENISFFIWGALRAYTEAGPPERIMPDAFFLISRRGVV